MKDNNKKIALTLILTIIFSLIQPLGIEKVFASETRYGCSYPNQKTNTVKFIAKAEGYDCAYVAGAFNEWKKVKDDKYKLTWKQDPNDGVWKMMGNISIDDLIKSGNQTNQTTGASVQVNTDSTEAKCEYKFILVKEGQPDQWMSNDGTDGPNSSFTWKYFNTSLTINTSSNFVTPNKPVDIVVVENGLNGNREILNNVVSIEPAVTGASIDNNQLKISQAIASGTKITLKATSGDLVETKEIEVSQTEKAGTLVHFFKQDSDYANWNFWSFEPGSQVDFEQDTDFGKAAFLTKSQVIARKGNWEAQTATYNIPSGSKDVYIIQGDINLYTDIESAVRASGPSIKSAIMDSENRITAYLSDTPLSTNNFKLYVNGVNVTTGTAATATIYENDKKVVFDTSGISIDPTTLIEIKADNMFTNYKKVTLRNVLDNYFYDGKDMGATFEGDNIGLKLWAPTAYKVEALVYDSYGTDRDNPSRVYQMKLNKSNGIHSRLITKAENENKYYMYRLYFKDRNTNGDIVDRITYAVDPYAYAVCANGTKGALVDLNNIDTKPTDWSTDTKPALTNPEDSILYEMHIRDFTIDSTSGVDADKRGKYLGAVQEETTYTDGTNTVKTGIDHLKELGVTHVHLLPVFDFASVDETKGNLKDNGDANRNWGYDPQNFNVPEGSYSSNASNPIARIKEFREMVRGFHKNGIRVVMDMVYNHMYSTDNMNNIVPDYYFRSWDNGSLSNASGCGNEIASERPMVRKFIIDSNMHWINDYNIDGLRFDLMAILDKTTMNDVQLEAKAIDPSIIVYGEPWNAASSPLSEDDQTKKNNEGIGAFNDAFRDAIRGNNDLGKGFIDGAAGDSSNSGTVQEGIRGTTSGTFSDPELTINYAEAHDNYCLWDQVEKTQTGVANGSLREGIPDNALTDWRVNQDILGSGIVLTSQGIPFIQEGSEILRTKQGDHNSYKSDDEINDIDWADKAAYKEVFDYYAGLMKLRKEHPAFRMTSKSQIRDHQEVYTLNGDNELIIQHLKNNANGDKWKNILVIYNGSANSKTINWLPASIKGTWNIVADKSGINLNTPIGTITQSGNNVNYAIPANSMMVLYDAELTEQEIISGKLEWDYLFSDQSTDYMSPMEPTQNDDVKVRFRARTDQVESANVHYYDAGDSSEHTISMSKITDLNFYAQKGYDSSKIEFWEGIIPKSSSTKYYNFEVIGKNAEIAWISGGAGSNNRGVTSSAPTINGSGIDHGFSIVPGFSTPQWSKESILYQVMVDRFRDGDPKNNRVGKDPSQFGNPSEVSAWGTQVFNGNESDKVWNNQFFGGDLTGVKEAIPYLKNTLGVTGLYLMPVFESQSDHKYDADTYDYVDKNFGGNKGLADLSSSLKTNGMNLLLDGVFNHTSTEGPLFKNHRDYYFNGTFTDRNGNALDYYPWHGYSNLAKLNYGNQNVKDYIYNGENSIAKRYLKAPYNIDGWRLDAAEDLNTQPRDYKGGVNADGATDPTQQANNLKIWQEFNSQVRGVKNNAFILGEFWGNDNQWYYGKAWDGKMNYGGFLMPFIENRNGNQWLGNQSLDNNGNMSVADIGIFTRGYFKNFPYQTILNSTNSISTHDKPRFLNWNYTGEGNTGMMELGAALQMTYPGIPMIYYGDEIGTAGKGTGADPYNRGTFNWNVQNWNLKMFNDYKKLIETRKVNKDAFVYGAFEEIVSNQSNKYIVYSRYGNNNKALVILNNRGAGSTQSITVDRLERYGFKDGDVLKDVMTGNTVTVGNSKAVLASRDMSAAVYVLSEKAPNASEVTALTNLGLTDENDDRTKLSTVENAKIASYTNGVDLVWSDYKDKAKASNIIVRAFDGNKVIKEVKVAATEKTATLPDITSDDITSGKYTISIKVEANRDLSDSVVNDIYMDSDYILVGQDITPPSIVSTAPISGSTNIEAASNVVFNFNENIAIADAGKISMVDNVGNPIAFTATVSGNQLIVNPNQDLSEGSLYTVIVTAGAVKDEANNLLTLDATMNFVTKQANTQSSNNSSSSGNSPSSSSSSNSASTNAVTTSIVDKAIQISSSEEVKIDMASKGSIIEKGVFELLAENPNKNLVLEGSNYSWTFAGIDISNNNGLLKDIDTKVSTTSPNAKEIDKVTLGTPVVNIYFSYHGELPGKAKVEIKIDPKYDRKTMLMYYYNSVYNRLELVSSNVQVKNGRAILDITHCSDYILSETEIPGAVKQGWNKNSDGTWTFLKADFTNYIGWLYDNGKWYFIQPSGKMQTGWLNLNGLWYYLNENGDMQMGWKEVDGKWYYLSSSGDMETGWLNLNDSWYYLDKNGDMQVGWKEVDRKWYYLYSNGQMAKNIVVDGWYLNSNGEGIKIA